MKKPEMLIAMCIGCTNEFGDNLIKCCSCPMLKYKNIENTNRNISINL